MKRNKIYMMCMILAGILFFGSVGAIVRICMSYREGEQVYEELEEYIREPESTKEPEVEKSSEENSAFTFLQVDFESLQSINPEVIAWIQIPALDISYPVAKGTDNAYYLHHMINGETNKSGSIFMDYHNQEDFTDRNTIIYGHNMRDGSMFGTLEQYQDPGVYDVYPKFYVYVPGYVYEYHIFSCYAAPVNNAAYTYSFPDVKDYQDFLGVIQASSEYDTGISVSEKDRVITLSNLRRMEETLPVCKEIPLQSFIASLYENAKIVCEKNGKDLLLQNNISVSKVALDSTFITQVCSHLISNAVRYARTTVTMSISSDNNGFLLSVSDDGEGFHKSSLLRATDPYFTEKSDSEHLGLGLYICRVLCKLHNGYLKIANTADGAKVSAYFKRPDS